MNLRELAMEIAVTGDEKKILDLLETVEFYANHPSVIKEAYHSNDEKQITVVHTFINHKATECLERINNGK